MRHFEQFSNNVERYCISLQLKQTFLRCHVKAKQIRKHFSREVQSCSTKVMIGKKKCVHLCTPSPHHAIRSRPIVTKCYLHRCKHYNLSITPVYFIIFAFSFANHNKCKRSSLSDDKCQFRTLEQIPRGKICLFPLLWQSWLSVLLEYPLE